MNQHFQDSVRRSIERSLEDIRNDERALISLARLNPNHAKFVGRMMADRWKLRMQALYLQAAAAGIPYSTILKPA